MWNSDSHIHAKTYEKLFDSLKMNIFDLNLDICLAPTFLDPQFLLLRNLDCSCKHKKYAYGQVVHSNYIYTLIIQ